MQKETLFLIFSGDSLINSTFDYFYFKRLLKKYNDSRIKVKGRKVETEKILEISTAAK